MLRRYVRPSCSGKRLVTGLVVEVRGLGKSKRESVPVAVRLRGLYEATPDSAAILAVEVARRYGRGRTFSVIEIDVRVGRWVAGRAIRPRL